MILLLLLALFLAGCSHPPSQNTAAICALDPESGVTLWSSARGAGPVLGPLVGCLRVGEQLEGLDLKSGRQLWESAPPPGKLSVEGDLLLALEGSTLTAREARNPSAVLWSATVLSDMLAVDLQDGVLLLRGKNGLAALEAASGRELWRRDGDYGAAVLRSGRVFAAQAGRTSLEACQLRNGELIWTATLSGVAFSLVACDDESVAVRTGGSTLEGYTAAAGRQLFRLPTELELAGGNEGLLALSGPGTARVLRASDGQLVVELKEGLARKVELAEGRLFSLVGQPGAFQVKAFEATSGKQLWARNCAGGTGEFPRLAGGRLIVPFEVRP